MSHYVSATDPIDFKQPIAKLFYRLFNELAALPSYLPKHEKQRWQAHPLYIRWTSSPYRQYFEGTVACVKTDLESIPADQTLGFIRGAPLGNHVARLLASDYAIVQPIDGESSDRREARCALLYAVMTLIDTSFGPVYEQAARMASIRPVNLAPDGRVEEGIIRSHQINGTPSRLSKDSPQATVIETVRFALSQEFRNLAPGGWSSQGSSINWLVLPRKTQPRPKPTLALIDHLGTQARLDLTLQPEEYDPNVPYFNIVGHPESRVPLIQARIRSLFDYFDCLPSGMPAVLCFPELSAGTETLTAIRDALSQRSRTERAIPDLTFVGHTHLPSGKAGSYHNEVHVLFGSEPLYVTFRKRNPYIHQLSGGSEWMENIEGSNELLLLDVPGYGRITVAICKDFLSLDPGALFAVDVRLVIVPAMTSPTSVVEEFVPKARSLAGIGVTTLFVNSCWHVTEEQLAAYVKKRGDRPIAGFFFPAVRRSSTNLAKHDFAQREICGGLYELRDKLQFIDDVAIA